jgi:hypothetical protein
MMDQMGESMGIIAERMKGVVETLGRMEEDETMKDNSEMQKEMTCLREHLGNMGDQMQITLQIMERITNRLGQDESEK